MPQMDCEVMATFIGFFLHQGRERHVSDFGRLFLHSSKRDFYS